ncbi:hypothetical protein M9Y10_010078 [Tritrichomonas musculus]|uniref:Uncharacterized protein n=1 Tax=Tritrichomonas musculus TaxID=1915356 RepID=A0ABR2IRE6_9EUKA
MTRFSKSRNSILLFANRNIEEISIPSNIKIISSFAFNNCKKLRKVEFPTNSKLETIGPNAFSSSGIEGISIPSSVSKTHKSAFDDCRNIQIIEISEKSKLKSFPSPSHFKNSPNLVIMFPQTLKRLVVKKIKH